METQFVKKLNRTETGFHILSLLLRIDKKTSEAERKVINQFLEEFVEEPIELIKEQAFVNALPEEEFDSYYDEICNHFYTISSPEDRHHIFNFAMKACMADKIMHPEENRYIGHLMNAWDVAR